jgi:predicted metal-dependent peptidase
MGAMAEAADSSARANAADRAAASSVLQHRGTRAVQRMVEFAPSTGGLALWATHEDLADQAALPNPGSAAPRVRTPAPVITDGHTIFYAAEFEALPVAEQVGLVAHEVLHVALRHPQRYLELKQLLGDVDLQLFNTCADAIVNSTLEHLSWLKLPAAAVLLDKLLSGANLATESVEKSLLEWDVERLYRAIDDRRTPKTGTRRIQDPDGSSKSTDPRQDGPRSAKVRSLGSRTPLDLVPGPHTQGPPEAEAEQTREWSERVLRAHAGDGAFSMLRALLADLPGTRTPWEQVLRTRLAHSLALKPERSWSRPSRSYLANQGRVGAHGRLPWEPGFSGTKAVPRLALIVDVSGSIQDELMTRFAREIEAIIRRQGAAMVLIVGDERVQHVERIDPDRGRPGSFDLRAIQFTGGGGTDFTPLLEEADRHRPDIAVVLTDLDGPVRFRPRWPVIWAVPEANRSAVPPFGRLLVLS